MQKQFILNYILLTALLFSGCSKRLAVLDLNDVRMFNPESADQILFLEFLVSQPEKGDMEKISLVSSVSGAGRLKNLRRSVEYPYQIQVIPRYRTSALEIPMVFEHPLFREVEVPDPSGTITRKKQFATEGSFTMRMQADPNIEKLEFFSVKPGKQPVKIYTLNLKQ
ncbi:hypothetical protein [Dyadobacter sp.]|uniref:hypothetical protein n=1 Tax=Dyadobacter sp. TaxID=1914288 RepID=UPI003F6E87CA